MSKRSVDKDDNVKYAFTGMLHRKDGKVTGAMSPVLGAIEFAKQMELKVHGLVRLDNDWSESTYDHLIIKTNYTNKSVYSLYCDMGGNLLPVAIWFNDIVDEVSITPIYLQNITPEAMKNHAANVESPKSTPIIIFDKKSIINMFKQANGSNEFKIK